MLPDGLPARTTLCWASRSPAFLWLTRPQFGAGLHRRPLEKKMAESLSRTVTGGILLD